MTKKWIRNLTSAVAVWLLGAGGMAQAALNPYTVNGVNLVYDDDRDLTWVANANLADTVDFGVSGISANGTMTWNVAQQWIAGMNAANYAGSTGWRLWEADPTCGVAYNCTGSELGHLFYTEGGLSAGSSINSSAALTAVFTNMQDSVYWSGTEYAPNPLNAWDFLTLRGDQTNYSKDHQSYGWAVRPGQVAAPIPEPETYALMLAGLVLVAMAARRRRG